MENFEACFVCGRVFTLEEDIYKVGDDYLCAHCHGKAFTEHTAVLQCDGHLCRQGKG